MPLLDQVPAGHRDRQPDSDDVPGTEEVPDLHFLQSEDEVEPSSSL